MAILAKKLAVENFAMLPETIWNVTREKMNTMYGSSWCGLKQEAVKHLVGRMQNEQSYGNVFSKIENTGLHFMKDTGRSFLHLNATLLHPEDETILMRFMCFANPVLLTLLMSAKLDIFIDATFSIPSPFYQTSL